MKKVIPINPVKITPSDCTCHTLAYGTIRYADQDHPVAALAVRSASCPAHPASKYLPKFVSR